MAKTKQKTRLKPSRHGPRNKKNERLQENFPFLLRPYLHGLDGLGNIDDTLQQDLNSKQFFEDITKYGLGYTYNKCPGHKAPEHYERTKYPKHVIIVGAGMAGLSSGYELSQSGHKVTILELQGRVGGRVKTITQPFAKGLHAEGGAMRIPPSHYLTNHYLDLFDVKTRPFQNKNPHAFYYFYGNRIKISDWNKCPGDYTDEYWKGWDDNLTPDLKTTLDITDIESYWEKTIEPVIKELEEDHGAEGWRKWVEKWSQFSVEEFLKTSTYQNPCCKLRPWPPAARDAFKVHGYAPFVDASLVEYLRDLVGKWGEDLKTPVDGMSALPLAFTRKNDKGWNHSVDLSKNIQYGIKIQNVKLQKNGSVTVSGRNEADKRPVTYTGDAVILTVPLTVLRNMDVPLSIEKQRAIANVNYMPSTKILLQCKTRFWQEDGIQGGFSKTNLPIGQLHYPDWDKSGIPDDERGILLVYTWGQDSLIFGAQKEDAIENAVNQIAKIHPKILTEFEVGAVQAWFGDPTEQGAFAFLKPGQYSAAIEPLMCHKSDHPIYLAGEAISWSNGWIQGAIESGLSAAYQFYAANEKLASR